MNLKYDLRPFIKIGFLFLLTHVESHLYTMSYNKSVRDGDLSGNKHSIALNTVSEVLRYIYIYIYIYIYEAPGFESPRELTSFRSQTCMCLKNLSFREN